MNAPQRATSVTVRVTKLNDITRLVTRWHGSAKCSTESAQSTVALLVRSTKLLETVQAGSVMSMEGRKSIDPLYNPRYRFCGNICFHSRDRFLSG